MADSNEDMTAMLIEAIDGLQAARYTSAAATTIYLYNIFLTLDLEIEYIWKPLSFTLPTLLYIINRYVGLGFFLLVMWDIAGFHGDLTDEYCKVPVDFIGFTLAHAVWTGIMTLRVSALWRQNSALVWLIRLLWTCVLAANITLGSLAYREVHSTIAYNPYIRICAPAAVPSLLKVQPIPPVIYELFLTALTLIKAFDFRVLISSPFPSIYRILARDGVAYFLVSATISTVNVIAWYCLPNSQLYLLLSIYVATMSTFMARMSLNLKAAHHHMVSEQLGTEGLTTAAFGSSTQSRVRSHIARGHQDLETTEFTVEDDRNEAWDTRSSQVPPTTQSLPLKRMDSKQKGESCGDYAETLPSDASGLSQRAS